MPKIATADRIGRDQLIDFVRTRHPVTLVHSDEWDGPYVQVDGTAEVLYMPAAEAEDALVDCA